MKADMNNIQPSIELNTQNETTAKFENSMEAATQNTTSESAVTNPGDGTANDDPQAIFDPTTWHWVKQGVQHVLDYATNPTKRDGP